MKSINVYLIYSIFLMIFNRFTFIKVNKKGNLKLEEEVNEFLKEIEEISNLKTCVDDGIDQNYSFEIDLREDQDLSMNSSEQESKNNASLELGMDSMHKTSNNNASQSIDNSYNEYIKEINKSGDVCLKDLSALIMNDLYNDYFDKLQEEILNMNIPIPQSSITSCGLKQLSNNSLKEDSKYKCILQKTFIKNLENEKIQGNVKEKSNIGKDVKNKKEYKIMIYTKDIALPKKDKGPFMNYINNVEKNINNKSKFISSGGDIKFKIINELKDKAERIEYYLKTTCNLQKNQ